MLFRSTGSDLAITRWAYESSGASIEIGEEPAPKCNADINGDGKVDGADLGLLLSAWGDASNMPEADLNDDGVIDLYMV